MNFLKILVATFIVANSWAATEKKFTIDDVIAIAKQIQNIEASLAMSKLLNSDTSLLENNYAEAIKRLKNIFSNNPELVYAKDEKGSPVINYFITSTAAVAAFINNGFDINTAEGFKILKGLFHRLKYFILTQKTEHGNKASKSIDLLLDQASDETLDNAEKYIEEINQGFPEDKALSKLIKEAKERKKLYKEVAMGSQPILRELLPNDLALLIADYVSQGGAKH